MPPTPFRRFDPARLEALRARIRRLGGWAVEAGERGLDGPGLAVLGQDSARLIVVR